MKAIPFFPFFPFSFSLLFLFLFSFDFQRVFRSTRFSLSVSLSLRLSLSMASHNTLLVFHSLSLYVYRLSESLSLFPLSIYRLVECGYSVGWPRCSSPDVALSRSLLRRHSTLLSYSLSLFFSSKLFDLFIDYYQDGQKTANRRPRRRPVSSVKESKESKECERASDDAFNL